MPSNIEELTTLVRDLQRDGQSFALVGHTSNTYFLPGYSIPHLISTRQCRNYIIQDNHALCDCGVAVSRLAREMVNLGYQGFAGLVDLPGTVGAAIYGNAGCFCSSVSTLTEWVDLLMPDGTIQRTSSADLQFSHRSSVLKSHKMQGIILRASLRLTPGDVEQEQEKAKKAHLERLLTQPPAANNLGSVYSSSHRQSLLSIPFRAATWVYVSLWSAFHRPSVASIQQKKFETLLRLLGAHDLAPYLYGWNRFIWRDPRAHQLFWKYHRLHRFLFKRSDFEIEIKSHHTQ